MASPRPEPLGSEESTRGTRSLNPGMRRRRHGAGRPHRYRRRCHRHGPTHCSRRRPAQANPGRLRRMRDRIGDEVDTAHQCPVPHHPDRFWGNSAFSSTLPGPRDLVCGHHVVDDLSSTTCQMGWIAPALIFDISNRSSTISERRIDSCQCFGVYTNFIVGDHAVGDGLGHRRSREGVRRSG